MKVTKQSRREAKSLFRACLVNGLMDGDRVRRSVQRVIEVKPRGYQAILTHFQRLVKLEIQRRSARVESATALGPEMQNGLKAGLARLYGAGLNLDFAQNAALLGGLRIKVGSDVYDGSVRARLDALQDSF
ncbi:MAG TPA: F0F1 ATP synthase subunit delta [Methylomirabilota bacterium]|jgi:F-type H+-transporting ATPase subunit delta|nr:F0F1 ATP synthase subunit delta [Methylomirabilota bacterium]